MMKSGFTLVEVIISASLVAVLMVGLWTVFDIFSALQERADKDIPAPERLKEHFGGKRV